eukprot:gene1391-1534_t
MDKSLFFGLILFAVCFVIEQADGQKSCTYQGKAYQPYSKVYSDFDEKNNWCNVGICRGDGTIWQLIDVACRRATSTQPVPTGRGIITTLQQKKDDSVSTTTVKSTKGCTHEGTQYPHGSEIFRGVENNKRRCYLQVCIDGEVVMRNRECRHSTSIVVTTTPDNPTTVPGCLYNGKYYPLNSEIERGYRAGSNWCFGTNCHSSGQIEHWDNFNCFTTTNRPPKPSTAERTDEPRTDEPRTYEPRTDEPRTDEPRTDEPRTDEPRTDEPRTDEPKTDEPRTDEPKTYEPRTYEPTTYEPQLFERRTTEPIPSTIADMNFRGCIYNGKFYPIGSEIEKGYDEHSDWCYGTYCDESGQKVSWDAWNCKKKDLTTFPFVTTPPAPMTYPPTTIPFRHGCFSDGRFFQPGEDISEGYDQRSDWCYGSYCSYNGDILQWDKWNCRGTPTTAPPYPTTEPPYPTTEPHYPTTEPHYPTTESHYPTTEPSYPTTEPHYPTTEPAHDETVPRRMETTTEALPPSTTTKTATLTTVAPISRVITTTSPGCYFDGVMYDKDEVVYNHWVKDLKWCYGLVCNKDAKLIYWEGWECNAGAAVTVTSMPILPHIEEETKSDGKKKEGEKKSQRRLCVYKDERYFANQFIVKKCDDVTKKCSMLFCNRLGKIVPKLLTDITRKWEISRHIN